MRRCTKLDVLSALDGAAEELQLGMVFPEWMKIPEASAKQLRTTMTHAYLFVLAAQQAMTYLVDGKGERTVVISPDHPGATQGLETTTKTMDREGTNARKRARS